jgi:hypothetical protein
MKHKTPRGTARMQRRKNCIHFDISHDGKNCNRVKFHTGNKNDCIRVFSENIEAAYKKIGMKVPE